MSVVAEALRTFISQAALQYVDWRMWISYKTTCMQSEYTCTINHQLCVKPVRTNLYPTSYISHQKLRKHTGPFQHHKNCEDRGKKTAHTICDSHNLGFRKDIVAKWKDGSDDITGKRNKVSWRKASRMAETDIHFLMVNDWVHSRDKHLVHATVCPVSIRKKDNLFHRSVLYGTDWLQVLSSHVGNGEFFSSLVRMWFLRSVFTPRHATLA